jgi:hypothetical protein
MFLTTPTIEELQSLELATLMDMLAYQTNLHTQLLKQEGISNTTSMCKQCIKNIQAVIEMKRQMKKNSTNTGTDISYIRNIAPLDPST